ncbi:MAG: Fur family transcriptional regulator [Candidatus Freyarchaeota archaeon]
MVTNSTLRQFIGNLRREGYKATPQRIEIFKTVKSCKKHPTAEDIYREVNRKVPTISRATVYKSLELFEKMGEIHPIGQIDGKTVYDSNPKPHVNLHCLNCGTIEDVESELLQKLMEEVQRKTESRIVSQSVNFYGYCSDCRNQKKRGEATRAGLFRVSV